MVEDEERQVNDSTINPEQDISYEYAINEFLVHVFIICQEPDQSKKHVTCVMKKYDQGSHFPIIENIGKSHQKESHSMMEQEFIILLFIHVAENVLKERFGVDCDADH